MSWNQTRVSERLNIQYPIIQGPFGGGLSTLELLTIVSNSGGMGSYGAHILAPDDIIALVAAARQRTDKAFNINLWVSDHDAHGLDLDPASFERYLKLFKPFYDQLGVEYPDYPQNISQRFEEQVEAVIEAAPPVLSFVFGIPDKKVLQACKQRDIITMGAATTFDEARAITEAGIDIVLATGFEAGGHRVAFLKPAEQSLVGTYTLVRQIDHSLDVPLIAAGGIADARGIAAIQTAGAHAVQMGTAFLACRESGTSDEHKQVLFSDKAHNTVLSRNYTGRLARFIPDEFIEAIDKTEGLPLPFPLHSFFVAPIKAAAKAAGNAGFSSHYAGQGAPLLKHRDADALMSALVEELDCLN
ncbi:nitronate monooxygenase [Maricurvus nonylphenolicus]|uniref:NAD(P)H-dependent flavin oxidoreductase n=1 Tax=Maricurvus nonylphenolicus TaxID=1008307 RepID=UPI0036F2A62D